MTYDRTTPIKGATSVTVEQAIVYAKSKGAKGNVDAYLRFMWRVAPEWGLNPLMVMGQWCDETATGTSPRWLKGDPAGIGIFADDTPSTLPGNLTGAQSGAIHIAELACKVLGSMEASTVGGFEVFDFDPHLDRVEQFVHHAQWPDVRTLHDLRQPLSFSPGDFVWAANQAYGDQIASHMNAIQAFADAHPSKETAMPDTKPTILVIAGHRSHGDAGNPNEKALTPALARSYRDAFRAAGYDCIWLQESDGDADPDDTVGGLDTVSQKAAQWLARQPGDCILFDLHYEGSPARGCFAIIPDVTGLRTGAPAAQDPADTWENNALDRALGRALVDGIATRTGLPLRQGIREPGLMDESQTGVGGQGYRLATFAYTSPYRAKAVRLVVEHGNHTHAADAAIIARDDFSDRCAAAAVDAVLATYGGEVVDPTPAFPAPELPDFYARVNAHDSPSRFEWQGNTWYPQRANVKAKSATRVYTRPDIKSPHAGEPIPKGATVAVEWIFEDAAGKSWLVNARGYHAGAKYTPRLLVPEPR